MKLRCLSKGNGYHYPPSHIITVCGFEVLLECPVDLSRLTIFSPVAHVPNEISNVLIRGVPWYLIPYNLNLWDVSSIDVVLISSPMGMLGLPFLTRNHKFSAKIYATEATTRLGKLMMEDLISMHIEYRQFYGPEEQEFPQWMKWDELEMLPLALREIVMGKDGSELGNWQSLYSAADVEDCMQKVQPLKYAEEACYNGTLIIKAFSSGLEIGTSNWTINGPRRNITLLSSSIFASAVAIEFDYHSLQGNDLILFSDFSALHNATGVCKNADDSKNDMKLEFKFPLPLDILALRDNSINQEELVESFVNTDESSEEMDKLAFICSCAVNSLKEGGSVLIPIGRLGIVLQLLEQISVSLQSSNLKVPIFMISSVAQETLAFANIVPEWLCKQRQQKLYVGEPLFGHFELIKEKRLHLFPVIHSSNFPTLWQMPCIVFSPHWNLRLGPVVHLLRQWHGDPNCLLVLEEGVNVDVALLPFKPVKMKVLQCSFLSGIKIQKVQPLLKMLDPKLVLFPEQLRMQLVDADPNLSSLLYYYSENEKLRVPSLRDDFEADMVTDLALKLQPRRTRQENIAVARLKGKLLLRHGKHLLVPTEESLDCSLSQLLHWGYVNPNLLLLALQEKGMNGSLKKGEGIFDHTCLIHITEPDKATIEISATSTSISAADETLATLIFQVVSAVYDGI